VKTAPRQTRALRRRAEASRVTARIELLDGTPPGIPRTVAAAASVIGRAVTRRSASARWFDTVWPTT